MRLQAGLREPAYEASVRSMLAGGLLGEEELNIHQNDNKKIPKNSKETKISKKVGNEDKEKNRCSSMKKGEKFINSNAQLICHVNDDGTISDNMKVESSVSNEEQEGPTETEDVDEEEEEGMEGEEHSSDSDSEDSDDNESNSDTDNDNDNDNDDDKEGDDGWVDRKGSDGKYRKQLPARDDPAARTAEKDSRKEARKIAKEQTAKKRQEKVPKHVKKRAIKAGKKK